MDHEFFTIEQACNFLAENKGWLKPHSPIKTGPGTSWPQDSGAHDLVFDDWLLLKNGLVQKFSRQHPIERTLDSASSCLPPEFELFELTKQPHGYIARAYLKGFCESIVSSLGETEMHARFNLAVACIVAKKEWDNEC